GRCLVLTGFGRILKETVFASQKTASIWIRAMNETNALFSLLVTMHHFIIARPFNSDKQQKHSKHRLIRVLLFSTIILDAATMKEMEVTTLKWCNLLPIRVKLEISEFSEKRLLLGLNKPETLLPLVLLLFLFEIGAGAALIEKDTKVYHITFIHVL
ncbi:hypothetical protein ACJX0J_035665, partial [Zea mays]